MMKRWVYGTIAGLALIASACGTNNAAPGNNAGTGAGTYGNPMVATGTGADNTAFGGNRADGYYGTTMNNAGFGGTTGANMMTRNNSLYARGGNTMANTPRLGFARVDSNLMRTNAAPGQMVYVDRDALARLVGHVTASVPGCMSSQVLVTDEEVFVGLTPQANQDIRAMEEKARINAASVAPGYYKVFVTSRPALIQQMNRAAGQGFNVTAGTPQDDTYIDQLVQQFGGQPEGRDHTRTWQSNTMGQQGGKSR